MLPNGLRALLISDPSPEDDDEDCLDSSLFSLIDESSFTEGDVKLAALALMVDAGSINDPKQYQGLAHLLEHMIFLGSTKFPSENEFLNHITKFGGSLNACTYAEETKYHFSVYDDHLESSMKRLVSLIKEPLLEKISMIRERNVIESEFVEKKQNEGNRKYGLLASVCGRPEHIASSFKSGNNKSLRDDVEDDDLHIQLVKFKNKYYQADRMYLCVQSPSTLDVLEGLVVRNFSELESSPRQSINDFEGMSYNNAFTNDYYNKIFLVKSVSKGYVLDITWCLPSLHQVGKLLPTFNTEFK